MNLSINQREIIIGSIQQEDQRWS